MATLVDISLIRPVARPRVALWLIAAAVLTTLLVLLSIAVKNGPMPSQDQTVLQ